MQIYLITHAHTEQIPGVTADTWRLSEKGIEQASVLASAPFWQQVQRVVVSSELKAWLTVAGVVAARRLPVWVDSRFDELRRSGWRDDYAAMVAAVFAQPERSIAGWESAYSVQMRALRGLAALQRRFAGETVALVGHGICLSLLRAKLLGQSHVDFSEWRRLEFCSHAHSTLSPATVIKDFDLSAEKTR